VRAPRESAAGGGLILARAEYEQQIGGFYRRADQMRCVDRRQSAASILRGLPRVTAGTGASRMPCVGRIAKSHFIALDCGFSHREDYGSNASGK
jgi:hypothetical protein